MGGRPQKGDNVSGGGGEVIEGCGSWSAGEGGCLKEIESETAAEEEEEEGVGIRETLLKVRKNSKFLSSQLL